MLNAQQVRQFADHWIHAWNSHDLEAILSHYSPDVVLTSPVAAQLLNDPSGTVAGREALSAYFKRGLEAYPNLTFTLHDVLCGLDTVVLYYTNHKGTKTAEVVQLGPDNKVVRVLATYSV